MSSPLWALTQPCLTASLRLSDRLALRSAQFLKKPEAKKKGRR